jgi:SSS family solute:Na+ symporter
MNRRVIILMLACIASLGAERPVTDGPVSRCYDVLISALKDESPWVRAHAAEALVLSKRPQPALAAFRPIAETSEPRYRVVVWRILAQAEPEPPERRRYVERIRAALLDRTGPDQTHAMEALAKLHEPCVDDFERRHVHEVAGGGGPASPFAVWRLAQANDPTVVERLVKLLRADDATTRARAAYVLARIGSSSHAATDALATALKSEPADSPARVMLRVAQGPDAARELAKDTQGPPSGRYFAAMYLAEHGAADDGALLGRLLNDSDADVCVAAAYAILQIDSRTGANAPSTRPG